MHNYPVVLSLAERQKNSALQAVAAMLLGEK
jgi:hypothetical protein